MSRINLVQLENMTPAQRAQYERFPANLTRALLCTSASTAGYLTLGASFRDAKLNARERELVILRVGSLSGSSYERMQHYPIARATGWSDQEIVAIESGDQSNLGPLSAALIRFIDECVHHVKVSAATFASLGSFFSEQEIAETTLLIGHYMMTARFLETLEVELDDAPTSWSGMSST